MSRAVLVAIAAGLASGVLYMAVVAGTMGGVIFAYLSQVPLFLAGLGLGLPALSIAGAVALLIIAGVGGFVSAALLLATSIGPVWLLTRQALLNRPSAGAGAGGAVEWYPPGLLLAWLSAMAAVGIVAASLFLLGDPQGIEEAVRANLLAAITAMMPPEAASPESAAQLAAGFARVFLGTVAVSWMTMVVVNGSLAQGLLKGFGRNLRPSPSVVDIELPRWSYAALLVSALIAVAAGGSLGYIARNLAMAFTVPFFFQGLGVMHALIGRWSARALSLFVFYVVLVVLVWPVALVIAAGLAEPLVRVRQRLGKPRGHEEDKQ